MVTNSSNLINWKFKCDSLLKPNNVKRLFVTYQNSEWEGVNLYCSWIRYWGLKNNKP